MSYYEIIDALFNIPHSAIFFYYIAKVFCKKNRKKYIAAATFLSFVIVCLNNYSLISRNTRILCVFLVCILFVLPFTKEKKKAIVFCILQYIVLIVLETLISIFTFLIYGESIMIVYDMGNLLLFKSAMMSMSIACMQLMYKLWMRRYKDADNEINVFNFFLIFPGTFFLLTVLIFEMKMQNINSYIITLTVGMINIALNIVAFYMMEQTDKKKREEYKGKLLGLQVEKQMERKRELDADIEKAAVLRVHISSRIDETMELLRVKEGQKVHQCLEDIMDEIKVNYLYSNNKVADAIVSEKAEECYDRKIHLECRLIFPDGIKLSNAELCVVLSNLLDNGIRACERCVHPYITLTSKIQKGYLVINQTNSFDGRIENRKDGVISEHGLGFEILNSIAQRYEGKIFKEYNDSSFITTVIIKA